MRETSRCPFIIHVFHYGPRKFGYKVSAASISSSFVFKAHISQNVGYLIPGEQNTAQEHSQRRLRTYGSALDPTALTVWEMYPVKELIRL